MSSSDRQRGVDIFFGVVEVRRDADARVRAVVDDDLAADQLVRDGRAVRNVDDHGAAALGVVDRAC